MKRISALFLAAGLLLAAAEIHAHPGSGIVVDREGNVYFVDTGSGIWKIDREGKLTKLSAPAYHWMAIDIDKRLAGVTLPHYSRGGATVERDRNDPRVIVSSDFPIAVGPDGALYFPWFGAGDRLEIFRLTPSGTTTEFISVPSGRDGKPLRWLNDLTAAEDGSIYYTENRAIGRISPNGDVSTVAANITLTGCDSVPEVGPELGPYFRGLDVDAQGNVYVAATGCRTVLKIAPDKKVSTVLRASAPWSPTAVAVTGTDCYVLEYYHTPGDNRREWLPRVRKVSGDGTVVTIASIDHR
ncbi:MAG: hypothetical protein AB1428_08830 [Bacteroidota bacterium]